MHHDPIVWYPSCMPPKTTFPFVVVVKDLHGLLSNQMRQYKKYLHVLVLVGELHITEQSTQICILKVIINYLPS